LTEFDLRWGVPFHEARRDLLRIVKSDTILVGHSLQSDLKCLGIVHEKVVDTSILFPAPEIWGPGKKYKLQYLAGHFLRRQIQQSGKSFL
jgi:RNA exonuclease 1